MLIGEPREVVRYRDEIVDDLQLLDPGRVAHFSLFTPTLAPPAGPAEHLLDVRAGRGVRETFQLPVEGLNVTRLRIDFRRTRSNPRAGDGGQERAEFPGAVARVVPDEIQRHAPAPAYELHTVAWKLSGGYPAAACAGAWREIPVGRALHVVQGDSGPQIALDASHRDLRGILRGDIVFIRYRLSVGSLEQGSGSTEWIDRWSFGQTQAEDLVQNPPRLFPALNVAVFRDLLKDTMGENVRDEIVAHGSLLFSVD